MKKVLTTMSFIIFFGVISDAQITLPSKCVEEQIKETDKLFWDLRRYYTISKFECRMSDVFNSFNNKMPDFYKLSVLLYNELEIIQKQLRENNDYYSNLDKTKWLQIEYWLNGLWSSTKDLSTLISGVKRYSYSSQKDYDKNWMLAVLNDIGTYGYKTEKRTEFKNLANKWKNCGDNLISLVESHGKLVTSEITPKLQKVFKGFNCVDNFAYEAMVSEKQKKEWFIKAVRNMATLYPGYGSESCERKLFFGLLEQSNILENYKEAMNANFYFSYKTSF